MGEIILSDFFSTKAQANDFSARLSSIEENIYEIDFNLEDELENQIGTLKKDKLLSLLRENSVSLQSNAELSRFFGKIHETIKSLPLLDITVAIEPKEQILKSISNWFILNIKKQVLLEITIDPNIIAGAIIEFEGKRLDTSIKSDFEKICADNLANTV